MFEACVGTLSSLQEKLQNTQKNILYVSVLLFTEYQKIKNVNVFAVTLVFILLTLSFTRDSFLSLCQSLMPPHFCTDDVKQSEEDEGLLCKDFVSHITKWIFKCLYLW